MKGILNGMHEYDHPACTGIQNSSFFWVPFDALKGRLDGTYHELIGGRTLFGVSPHAGRGKKRKTDTSPIEKRI